jgi:hypothetical protein
VRFGDDLVFHMRFDSLQNETPEWQTDGVMELTGVAGTNDGVSAIERISVTPLEANVFLLSWQDSSGNTYVQVNDFAGGQAYLNLTLPDNLEETNTKLLNFEGSLRRIPTEPGEEQ